MCFCKSEKSKVLIAKRDLKVYEEVRIHSWRLGDGRWI